MFIGMYELDIDKISFEINMKVPKIKEMLVLLLRRYGMTHDRHIVWVVNHFRHQFMRTENISGKILEGARKCLISHRGHNFVADFLNLSKPLDFIYY